MKYGVSGNIVKSTGCLEIHLKGKKYRVSGSTVNSKECIEIQ